MSSNAIAYFRDPAVSVWRKLAGLAAVAYAAMPVDALPDVIPVIGWLDDLGVLSMATLYMMREIRRHAESRGLIKVSVRR